MITSARVPTCQATKSAPSAQAVTQLQQGSLRLLNIGWGWSSPAAGTAGRSARCCMSNAETDPRSCKQELQEKFSIYNPSLLPAPLLRLLGPTGVISQKVERMEPSFLVAAPADIQTRGYLIWIYCPHVTFMRWICLLESFTDRPQGYQKLHSCIQPSHTLLSLCFVSFFLAKIASQTPEIKS